MYLQRLQPGAKVFFKHKEKSWTVGSLVSKEKDKAGETATCKDTADGEVTAKLKDDEVFPISDGVMDLELDDLLELSTELHEAILLVLLNNRYQKDNVYTKIGDLIVALNPFSFSIPHYKDDMMIHYIKEGKVITKNKPHSWCVAHSSYWRMVDESTDQCILISGESGAGKTEGAKLVQRYLGAMSTFRGGPEHAENSTKINEKIIQASPIMESFGNAKTVRNDNSSRFGKFMKIQFNKAGILIGAHVTEYLLEKSRVLTAGPDERIYHIFYELVKGIKAFPDLKAKLKVGPVSDFPMLSSGNCTDIAGVADDDNFAITFKAMDVVGFSSSEKDAVFRVVGGVMHLQTVQFTEANEQAAVKNEDKLNLAAELLMVDKALLKDAVVSYMITVGKEKTRKFYNTTNAISARDSICRLLYEKAFSWIVTKINSTTDKSADTTNFIGLLDIFGFESFQVNSFEQLCINLANEQLQNHYNEFTFNKDVEECKAEGIDVQSVELKNDNTLCVKLMTDKQGVLGLLDDECALQAGTDNGFLENLDKKVGSKGSKSPFYFKDPAKMAGMFAIKHYAGQVTYTVAGWLEKNKDVIKDDVRVCFGEATCDFVKSLIPPPLEKKGGRPPTVAGTFTESLKRLMELINSTKPNWIRCIKPHPAKRPKMFKNSTTLEQLTSAGVIETIKMRKAGYAYRIPFQLFYNKFNVFLAKRPTDKTNFAGPCADIIKAMGFESKDAQVGKTKVFLRIHAYIKLDEERDKRMEKYYTLIKQMARYKLSCMRLYRQRKLVSVKIVQREIREYLKASAATRVEREIAKKALLEKQAAVRAQFLEDQQAAYQQLLQGMVDMFKEIKEMETQQKGIAVDKERTNLGTNETLKRNQMEQIEIQERINLMNLEESGYLEKLLQLKQRLERQRAMKSIQQQEIANDESGSREDLISAEAQERGQMYNSMAPTLLKIRDELAYRDECHRRRQKKIQILNELKEKEAIRVAIEREELLRQRREEMAILEHRRKIETQVKQERHNRMHEQTSMLRDYYSGQKDIGSLGGFPLQSEGGVIRFDEYSAKWRESYWKDKLTGEEKPSRTY